MSGLRSIASGSGIVFSTLAGQGIMIGTSSWKYPGWVGQIYSREPYLARGAFSQKRFEAECLAEYARTFPVVCGDFTFYQFPTEAHWRKLFGGVPETLGFAFKVPEEITARVFPKHPRYGARGGTVNRSFLDAELLTENFLKPLDPYRGQVRTLVLEFGALLRELLSERARVRRGPRPLPGGTAAQLPLFSGNPKPGVPCARLLRVSGAPQRGPRVQRLDAHAGIARADRDPDAVTTDFTVCRALLRRGRAYADAVQLFSPYEELQDPNPEGRQAIKELIDWAKANRRAAFIFVNNRFEGSAPRTIEAIVS